MCQMTNVIKHTFDVFHRPAPFLRVSKNTRAGAATDLWTGLVRLMLPEPANG